MQPQLADTHARQSVHVLGILNFAMGEHRPNRDPATLTSSRIKHWYILPALNHSPDERTERRKRFALVETGKMIRLLLP